LPLQLDFILLTKTIPAVSQRYDNIILNTLIMQKNIYRGVQILISILVLLFAISCVSVEKLRYLNDIDELQVPYINPKEPKLIMPFDKINIRVLSIDEKTNDLFNSNTNSDIGYLVDNIGNINYPFIGKINVLGLTPEQAGKKLGTALSEYVSDASVTVSFVEVNVTVMGQVQSQGIFPFTQDKLTIYEALALGGGVTQYGDRKNVILIRQEGDKIMHHKLDLSDSRIAGKEYYYIQANDVIIVEPLRIAAWYQFNNSSFTVILSVFTSIVVFSSFLFR
jgi:polysaccharide export outer membrane protein